MSVTPTQYLKSKQTHVLCITGSRRHLQSAYPVCEVLERHDTNSHHDSRPEHDEDEGESHRARIGQVARLLESGGHLLQRWPVVHLVQPRQLQLPAQTQRL